LEKTMSFERCMPPIMTDAIMYHNESNLWFFSTCFNLIFS